MKKFSVLVSALALLIASAGVSFADVRNGNPATYSKTLGGSSSNAVLVTGNVRVTSISLASTGSAGIISVYDATQISSDPTLGLVNGNLIAEVGAPASDSRIVTFSSPIICSQGVSVFQNGNVSGYAVDVEATQ